MEIGHKVSFIILVFWCFIIVFVVWLFIVLSSVFLSFYPASCVLHLHPFYRLPGQLIIGVTWVNLVGWAGREQCTELASWPLDKMYMLLLAVSAQCLS